MASEKFCLRWNDFESNISTAFRELRDDKDFFDVTLACDDEQIQAHKVILSACSPFFKAVLRRNPHAHPLLYLKGVKYHDLQSVLQFMYHGEVNVAQEELNSFLAVAEELRVKGLTQGQSAPPLPPTQHPRKSSSFAEPSPREQPAPPKRSRPSLQQQQTPSPRVEVDVEVQEVTQPIVKSEPSAHYPVPEHSVATYQGEEAGYGEEDYGAYEDESAYEGGVQLADTAKGSGLGFGLDNPKLPEDLYAFCIKEPGDPKWTCALCAIFSHNGRGQVRNHVESRHFPNVFEYHCKICLKTCSTKKGLEVHMSEKHRNQVQEQKYVGNV